jgi:hypothetical protein
LHSLLSLYKPDSSLHWCAPSTRVRNIFGLHEKGASAQKSYQTVARSALSSSSTPPTTSALRGRVSARRTTHIMYDLIDSSEDGETSRYRLFISALLSEIAGAPAANRMVSWSLPTGGRVPYRSCRRHRRSYSACVAPISDTSLLSMTLAPFSAS